MKGSCLILAPYRGDENHIGNFRIDRFERWLHSSGYNVIIIRAGKSDRVEQKEMSTWVTIKDPLNMHGEVGNDHTYEYHHRKPNSLRRWLAYALFNPDPVIIWAKRCIKHPLLIPYLKNARLIFASSPSESSFITAIKWADKYNIPFWMDMRDGWIDEPMKPLLLKFRLQKFRELRLERKCLKAARIVTVTSGKWKESLELRYPTIKEKTHVLTNGYMIDYQVLTDKIKFIESDEITLFHAGRIFSSRPERTISQLLEPVLSFLTFSNKYKKGKIYFTGNLSTEETTSIFAYKQRFEKLGWNIITEAGLSRKDVIAKMAASNGLLMLSPSKGSIPAKFFDYISSGRPILAVTVPGSAVAQESSGIKSVTILDITNQGNYVKYLTDFFDQCIQKSGFNVPDKYEDKTLQKQFNSILNTL